MDAPPSRPEGEFEISTVVDSLQDLGRSVAARLPYVAVGILVFVVLALLGKLAGRVTRRASARLRTERALGELFGRIVATSVTIAGAIAGCVVVFPGLKMGDVFTGLGITSIAAGFALKDVLQNFVAGILLLVRRPFRVGDQIRTRDHEGTVEDVDVRATRLVTYDGERVIIPNGDVYTNVVVVRTARPSRRVRISVGIGYGDDIERARGVVRRVLGDIDAIHADPPPLVYVAELAPSAVVLHVYFWTASDQANVLRTTDAAYGRIKDALTSEGIDIPFPHTVVLFHDETTIPHGARGERRE